MNQAVALNQPDINNILSQVPHDFLHAKRLITYLSDNPDSMTDDVIKECGVNNILGVARRLNNLIFKHSLFISCKRDSGLSGGFAWGIYRIPRADK